MLSKEEVEKSIATDLGREWELIDGKLVKSFQFSSFMDAIDIVMKLLRLLRRVTIIQLLQLTGRVLNFL